MAKQFKHINNGNIFDKCSTCGASIKTAAITGTHVHGDQFEEVTYECGCRIAYVPNFKRVEIVYKCPKDKEVIETEEVIEDLKIRLCKMVDRANLPLVLKKCFKDDISEFKRDHYKISRFRHDPDNV